ncbi:MAG: YkgJ family cysteine cluster protein [Thermodesulfobacteriota bacterium]
MGKASKGKKFGKSPRTAGVAAHHLSNGRINQAISRMARENVVAIIHQGRVPDRALEIATSAFFLAEHLIRSVEAENPLPQKLACQEGCDACCHNLVELTPPEALLIGHHLSRHFSQADKDLVLSQVARNLALAAGKTKAALAAARQDLPCPLLRGHRCSVYPIRPLVCRAMHGLNRERCEVDLHSGNLAGSQYYAHRQEITLSVSAGVLEGCQAAGCQAGTLDLSRALQVFFSKEISVERWIMGDEVFPGLPGPQKA